MDKILTALHIDSPDSLKRAITTILGAICVLAVNPILTGRGLPPISDANLAMAAGLIATFLIQSGANSVAAKLAAAKAAGEAAAAKVDSPEKAAEVLK